MEELTFRIVARLRQDESCLSRNRNFHTFADPKAMRARRIARHLRNLEEDLIDHPVGVERDGDQIRVHLRYPELRAVRTAYLSRREYQLLLEDPKLAAVLE